MNGPTRPGGIRPQRSGARPERDRLDDPDQGAVDDREAGPPRPRHPDLGDLDGDHVDPEVGVGEGPRPRLTSSSKASRSDPRLGLRREPRSSPVRGSRRTIRRATTIGLTTTTRCSGKSPGELRLEQPERACLDLDQGAVAGDRVDPERARRRPRIGRRCRNAPSTGGGGSIPSGARLRPGPGIRRAGAVSTPRSRIVTSARKSTPPSLEGRGGAFEPVEHRDDPDDPAAHPFGPPASTAWRADPPVVVTSSTTTTSIPAATGPSTSLPVPCPLASLRTRNPTRPGREPAPASARVEPTIGSAPMVRPAHRGGPPAGPRRLRGPPGRSRRPPSAERVTVRPST